MIFNVPQFIDVEDKIAGPLTWRQLLWMIGMGAVLLVFYNLFDTQLFFIIAIPVVLMFVGLAFYRPNGMPLPMFIFHAVLFVFRPKVAVWERPVHRMPEVKKSSKKIEVDESHAGNKKLTQEKLRELAKIVDGYEGEKMVK